jgi:hypothetical protein
MPIIGMAFAFGTAFIAYNYFSAQQASAVGDPLVTSDGSASSSPFSAVQLNLLKKIESIKLDGAILRDQNFKNLQDWTVDIGTGDAGKLNPFAPLNSTQSAPKSKTTKR